MKMTLDEYYKINYTTYEMEFDNKGNFVYGKGIIGYKVIKDTEKALKEVIRKNRKNNIQAQILWNNKERRIANIRYR